MLLALIPLSVLILSVFGGLFVRGGGLERPLSWNSLILAFGSADAAKVFVESTALTVLLTLLMSSIWRPRDQTQSVVGVFFEGMMRMFVPVLILVFAWVLNGVIKELGTSAYLVSFLDQTLSPALLPALVFVLASIVSFSTGTSWGTMAIVMPLVVPIAANLTGFEFGSQAFVATIGAVLAGAVFGDHCSPISDTTIVSSLSSDCDHMEHVRTQLPYALAAAAIAVISGYALATFLKPAWLLLSGALGCWALVRFAGRPPVRTTAKRQCTG
jgi:Na+/H+ antiporter NhaC